MTDVAEMPRVEQGTENNLRWILRIVWNCVQVALMVGIIAFSAKAGIELRKNTWEFTKPVRFVPDITRNLIWGTEAANKGYLNLYERQKDQGIYDRPWLDYAPIRLAVMWGWGEWVKTHYPNPSKSSLYNSDGESNWEPSWEFNRPVLYTNMGVEGFNALGMFLLVRLWIIRHKRPEWKHDPFGLFSVRWWRNLFKDKVSMRAACEAPLTGCWRGLAAAVIGWFAPGILMSAYGWPTYDSWIVPAYIWAVLFASTERWFAAGMAVGIGAMAKGQILAVAPVFVLWPLFRGFLGAPWRWCGDVVRAIRSLENPLPYFRVSWRDAKRLGLRLLSRLSEPVRFLAGALMGIATLASPWMLTYPQLNPKRPQNSDWSLPRLTDWMAIKWVCGIVAVGIVVAVLAWLLRYTKRTWLICVVGGVASATAAVAVLWPLYRPGFPFCGWGVVAEVLGLLAIVLAIWILPWRGRVCAISASWGAALLLCVALFHGSWCWAQCGWGYGLKHWEHMTVGDASNVPGVLEATWEITNIKATAFNIPQNWLRWCPEWVQWWPAKRGLDVTWKMLLNSLFAGALVLCALAMARMSKRGDRWFLVAQATPFLVFFCLPVQVHERYLLFGAGVAMAAMGASTGMALLGYVLSFIAAVMTFMTAMSQLELYRADRATRIFYTHMSNIRVNVSPYPHMAWAVLAITGVFLWAGLFRRGKLARGSQEIPALALAGKK